MIKKTTNPGIYITETNAFPNSVVAVPTAVPAFIGYTPKAPFQGKSYLMKPVKVTSMLDFNAFFAFQPPEPGQPAPKQYNPQYYITKQKEVPAKGDHYTINGDLYTIEPDPFTIYYLYNSVKMYFQNGGGEAYIVSLGPYGAGSGAGKAPGTLIQNGNVKVVDMIKGLEALKKIAEVTMYICPEATLLNQADNQAVMQNMLKQCDEMQTAMSIFDIIGGEAPDPVTWSDDITTFRQNTGSDGLKYSAAYYPFLNTMITTADQVDYTNIQAGDTTVLHDLLNPPSAPNPQAQTVLDAIQNGSGQTVGQNNRALLAISPTYQLLMSIIQKKINIMPPSGSMAGIWSLTDETNGVWNAPANKTPMGVTDVTLRISDSEQGDLNVDAVTGKSINAIRYFNGQGVLVWGARTLDGNSDDWRYINVRRTVTMIEQSIKVAMRAYVFAANDSNTWASVQSMVENFLTNVWREGALQGAKASDAFSVAIGLGSTMTAQDILDGYLRLSAKIAVSHPAEFIVLQIEQQQATS